MMAHETFSESLYAQLKSQRESAKDQTISLYRRSRWIQFLKHELLVEHVCDLGRDKAVPFGQAVTDRSIDEPKLVIARAKGVSAVKHWSRKLTVLMYIGCFEPDTQSGGVEEAKA
jgi:hypothetical protein